MMTTQRHFLPLRYLPFRSRFIDLDSYEHMVDEFFTKPCMSRFSVQIPDLISSWAPPLDVIEGNDRLIIRVELPGMRTEDIDVSVEGNVLNIHGERKIDDTIHEKDFYKTERYYGYFRRSIPLLFPINLEKSEAHYENGILEIRLRKS